MQSNNKQLFMFYKVEHSDVSRVTICELLTLKRPKNYF